MLTLLLGALELQQQPTKPSPIEQIFGGSLQIEGKYIFDHARKFENQNPNF